MKTIRSVRVETYIFGYEIVVQECGEALLDHQLRILAFDPVGGNHQCILLPKCDLAAFIEALQELQSVLSQV